MTSGVFKTFPVSKIWVNREARQRREITDEEIAELAESIGRVGLIHPPVIRESGELVVGERRWRAMQFLGWTDTPIQFIEELPEDELRQVELEENVRRKDIPWLDECKAIREYHELLKAKDPEWTSANTAERLGSTRKMVEDKLNVAKAAQVDDRVTSAPKYSTAKNIVQRTAERQKASARDELSSALNEKKPDVPFLNEDFHSWSDSYTGEKFNLIFCDFPYGMSADKHDSGKGAELGGYEDSPVIFWDLLVTLTNAMEHIVDESAHLIFWFRLDDYEDTKRLLQNMGWKLDKRLLIWHKNDGSSILPDPNRGPRWCYETAFFGSRGDRKIVKAVDNLVASGITKEYHMSEKPLPVCRHFLRMLTDEFTSFLDPTCGSGNSVIAARELGARHYLGIERDSEFCERATENFRANAK